MSNDISGGLSDDDGDVNENNFAHAIRFLEHFFAVVARLRRETF